MKFATLLLMSALGLFAGEAALAADIERLVKSLKVVDADVGEDDAGKFSGLVGEAAAPRNDPSSLAALHRRAKLSP